MKMSQKMQHASSQAKRYEEMREGSSAEKSNKVLNSVDLENDGKSSSQIISSLDQYCRTNILDESSDFVECESKNQFRIDSKPTKRKADLFLCEICKEDITNLDVHNRGIHVNKCIDEQISCTSAQSMQSPEMDNIFILECPLCFKNFPSPEVRSNHIKKCGKSKGLGMQSLIKALELQERHALEREALGLPNKPPKVVKSLKSTSKRGAIEPKSKTQSDIQLAKALSLSLTNTNPANQTASNSGALSRIMLQAPSAELNPGRKPTKNKKGPSVAPLLVLRSDEDRKKLLLDKVASILAPVNKDDAVMDVEDLASSETLAKDPAEKPVLWGLSSKSSQKYNYYVEQLLDWIQPSDIEVGANLCHISQIAGHEIITQLPVDYTFRSQDNNDTAASVSGLFPNQDQSTSCIIDCLRSLVASSWMSDVDIHTACGTIIPAHRLLLAIRCPLLKKNFDFCSTSGKTTLKWDTVSFDVALQFLNFVYSGNIEAEEHMVSDLLYLAKKYEVCDLEEYLNSEWKSLCVIDPEANVKFFQDSNTEATPHSSNTASQTSVNKAHLFPDPEESFNPDLEIVYNCINSSLMPTQLSTQHSTSKCPELIVSPADHKSLRDSSVSPVSASNDCNESYCEPTIPEKQTVFDVGTTSEEYHSSSPVIFDVNDTEDDFSDNSQPTNYFSQRVQEVPCEKPVEMDDPNSGKSNSSEDSVKILNVPSCNSACSDPDNMGTRSILGSPKFSSSTLFVGSPQKGQISQANDSRNNRELSSEIYNLKDISFKPSDSDSNRSLEADSLPSPIGGLNSPRHANDEFVRSCSIFENDNAIKTCSKYVDDNFIKISDDSLDCVPDSSCNSKLIESENKMSNYEINSCSPVKSDTSKIRHGFLYDNLKDSSIFLPLSERLAAEKSNSLFASAKSGSMEHSPSKKREKSPEVLICDSDNEISSSPKQRSSSNSQIVSSIYNTDSVERTRKNASSPEVICFTSEGEQSPLEESWPLPQHPSSMDETIPFSRGLCTGANPKKMDSPNTSKISFKSVDDFVPTESFEVDVSIPDNELPSFHSTDSSGCAVTNHSLDTDDILQELSERIKPNTSCGVLTTTESKSVASERNIQSTSIKLPGTPTNKSNCPQPNFCFSDSPITPLPDFKQMMTPDIKQALRKYGVKAMPRRKAVALLSHIYDETHPLLNGEIASSSTVASPKKATKREKTTKPRKRKLPEDPEKPAKKMVTKEIVHPNGISLTSDSDDSSSENSEARQLGCIPEMSFSQCTQDSPTKSNVDDIELIKSYILSNEQLYGNILNYTPLNMVDFHQELKTNGIKISIQKLMDFLDEQCITFTCPRKEEYKKKQTARSNRFRKKMIAKLSQQAS